MSTPDEEQRRRARKGEEGDILAAARALREADRRPVSPHDAFSYDIYLPGKCDYCSKGMTISGAASEETKLVRLESSRTAYHWDGKGPDPNAPLALCAPCAKDHHEHWDEMWDAYYSGLL